MDGRISDNYVDEGNLVGRGEPTLLAKIVQSVPAYVSLDINEHDVLAVRRMREKAGSREGAEPGQISPGVWQPCELAIANEMVYRFPGRVDYVEPEMNKETGTLRVRTRYENADVGEQHHHDHVICDRCGRIVEFSDDDLERLQEDIATRLGFVLARHRLELYGICRDCREGVRPSAGADRVAITSRR